MALGDGDYMSGNHRSHGHPIGKGSPLGPLMAELVGKGTGVCGGKGGSLHLADFAVGSLGESGIVGSSIPIATGAAIAAPGRRVLNVEADGSAMYTLQALWTQAHEGLDVTTVIVNNASYAVLNMELARVGATPGPKALEMLDLSEPALDFVALASGMGVPASRVTTAEDLSAALAASFAEPGPRLIEAMVPSAF
jgi:thiamine pyrophosphate-dependent acetolactate synthase large subunit-like protein